MVVGLVRKEERVHHGAPQAQALADSAFSIHGSKGYPSGFSLDNGHVEKVRTVLGSFSSSCP